VNGVLNIGASEKVIVEEAVNLQVVTNGAITVEDVFRMPWGRYELVRDAVRRQYKDG